MSDGVFGVFVGGLNMSVRPEESPMSALPPIADIGEGIAECLLLTQSGHWSRWAPTSKSAEFGGPSVSQKQCVFVSSTL